MMRFITITLSGILGFTWVITCFLYAIAAPREVMAAAICLTGLITYIDFLVFMKCLAMHSQKKLEKLLSTSRTQVEHIQESIKK
jgi:hypothetical protein